MTPASPLSLIAAFGAPSQPPPPSNGAPELAFLDLLSAMLPAEWREGVPTFAFDDAPVSADGSGASNDRHAAGRSHTGSSDSSEPDAEGDAAKPEPKQDLPVVIPILFAPAFTPPLPASLPPLADPTPSVPSASAQPVDNTPITPLSTTPVIGLRTEPQTPAAGQRHETAGAETPEIELPETALSSLEPAPAPAPQPQDSASPKAPVAALGRDMLPTGGGKAGTPLATAALGHSLGGSLGLNQPIAEPAVTGVPVALDQPSPAPVQTPVFEVRRPLVPFAPALEAAGPESLAKEAPQPPRSIAPDDHPASQAARSASGQALLLGRRPVTLFEPNRETLPRDAVERAYPEPLPAHAPNPTAKRPEASSTPVAGGPAGLPRLEGATASSIPSSPPSGSAVPPSSLRQAEGESPSTANVFRERAEDVPTLVPTPEASQREVPVSGSRRPADSALPPPIRLRLFTIEAPGPTGHSRPTQSLETRSAPPAPDGSRMETKSSKSEPTLPFVLDRIEPARQTIECAEAPRQERAPATAPSQALPDTKAQPRVSGSPETPTDSHLAVPSIGNAGSGNALRLANSREKEPAADEPARASLPPRTALAAETAADEENGNRQRVLERAPLPTEAGPDPATPAAAGTLARPQLSGDTGMRSPSIDAGDGQREPPPPAEPVRAETRVGGPVREVRLIVDGPGHQTVEIKASDRSGEIQVALRTASEPATAALKGELRTLIESLEQTGYRAVEMEPSAAVAVTESATGGATGPERAELAHSEPLIESHRPPLLLGFGSETNSDQRRSAPRTYEPRRPRRRSGPEFSLTAEVQEGTIR